MQGLMKRSICTAAIFAGSLILASTALAEDCRLERAASLDMKLTHDGRILVPVSIEGTSELMMLDTGSPISIVFQHVVDSLKLITRNIYQGQVFTSAGSQFTALASIKNLQIDQMTARDVRFLVEPTSFSDDKALGGLLGSDIMHNYDVELDFEQRKVNLFLQTHCPGKVIYWPATAVAAIPFRTSSDSHIIIPVQLEGKELDALVDTGAGTSVLFLNAAQNQLGLHPGTPDLKQVGELHPGAPVYEHVFKSLGLDGIAISNIRFAVFENETAMAMRSTAETGTRIGSATEQNGVTDAILGIHELSKLHIFISYKEKMLYLTPPTTLPIVTPSPAH
jgi:predicted aspartyl protease